jgi:GNAT superfamily N-acetyltransferase
MDETKHAMIRLCEQREFEQIVAIINDAAHAYKGVIPEECWKEPYMSRDELQHELDAGVAFWGCEKNGKLCAVMGLQAMKDATLIRHAYVLTAFQRQGIGQKLLSHLRGLAKTPILIGTWADALWAIKFYEKNGFRLISPKRKHPLMQRYWTVSREQMEVSVVLADAAWPE